MSISRRISRIVRAKRSEKRLSEQNPLETVQDAHRGQADLVDQARRSVADLAANHRRLEILTAEASAELQYLNHQAQEAVSRGDDDGGRAALRRGIAVQKRLDTLTVQRRDTETQVRQLERTLDRLQSRVEDNSLRYEVLRARGEAAQASLGMQEALDTTSRTAAGADSAERDARLEARRIQAEADAREELAWSDPNSRRLQEAFEELEANSAADRQLSELKKNSSDSHRGQL